MPEITHDAAPCFVVALAEAESPSDSMRSNSRVRDSGVLQALVARNTDKAGTLRRSPSAPPRLAVNYKGNGIPEEIDKRLTALYGPSRPARAKEGQLAIQKTEFEPEDSQRSEKDRRTRVNPTRVWMTKAVEVNHAGESQRTPVVRIHSQSATKSAARPPESKLTCHLDLAALQRGDVAYKWDVSANGTLIVGESKPVDPETGLRTKQGHPTLVGGWAGDTRGPTWRRTEL